MASIEIEMHDRGCRARGGGRCTCPAQYRQGAEEVVDTPIGKFLVTRGEIIGETLRAGTVWDGPGFLQVIAKEYALGVDRQGGTILDVGANQGAFSIWCASQGAYRVIAVEPQPTVYQRLVANLDLNKQVTADRVIPLQIAAYDRKCFLAYSALDAGNWGGTAFRPVDQADRLRGEVPAVALDQLAWLFADRVSLIKIDAQGCDGRILLGLSATILRDHPAIVFEWEAQLVGAHGVTFEAVVGLLEPLGYAIHEWPTHPNNYLAVQRRRG